MKFGEFIFERKRIKISDKGKRIAVSKMDLEYICDKLGIDYHLLKFISSGSFGNSYRVGDKVLKLTSDKREAKSVNNLIKSGGNDSIVNYYSVNLYKNIYIILMDHITPVIEYYNDENIKEFISDCLTIIYDRFSKISYFTKEDLIKEISSDWEIKDGDRLHIDKIYKLYTDLKDLVKFPDIHIDNLGVDKIGNFILFDFTELLPVNKFNDPNLIQ